MKSLWGLWFLALPALAGTLEEDFSSFSHRGTSGTAIWNAGLGHLHVPLASDNTTVPVANENIDIGNGADGEFDETTYENFDTDGDVSSNTIVLDTSRTYQFTGFTLAAGYTLRGSGTAPLVIRVQGNAEIAGTVDLSGGNGDALNIDSGGAGDLLVQPQGGTACCGGGVGGNGGITTVPAGTNGGTGAVAGIGGGGGGSGAVGRAGGGGGGAAHSANGQTGEDPGGGGGAGGTAGAINGTQITRLGGSGGGGGGIYNLGPLGDNSTGAGGGGGGGSFQIYVGGSFVLASTGLINVTGGDGGGRTDLDRLGGGGGGGAGGSVYIYSGDTPSFRALIDARGGSGGAGSNEDAEPDGTADGLGGDGGDGYIWVVVPNGTLAGAVVGGTFQPLDVNLPGTSTYQTGTFTLESAVIDSKVPFPVFRGIETDQATPANTSLTLEVAGSTDAFNADDTGYLAITEFAQLSGKRYVKFRATLSTTVAGSTPTLGAVRFLFDSSMYEFSLTSCARVGEPNGPSGLGTAIFWGLLLLVPGGFRFASWGWHRITHRSLERA